MLTPEKIAKLKAALPTMPEAQKRKTADLLVKHYKEGVKTKAKDSFLSFIKHVYPGYKVGPHHYRLAKIFEDIAAGKKKRVIVNIAPRHGKSEMISYLAPAWFLGKYPHKKVIMASHTADLAVNFGRRVRNLVGSDLYHEIFPQVELQADSKSASRWGTNFNGEYFAIGVGGALAGRGADLFIIDDPHSEQDAKQNRADVFEPAWEWFQSGPIQRLMPGGAIIVVMCMTGDTPVLMADGTEKRLDQVRAGDYVATYDKGKLAVSCLLNHQSSGVDDVYTIQTRSGKILRANERHPFLVEQDGEQQWIRLKDLKPGMSLVALKVAQDLPGRNENPAFAPLAEREPATTANTPMHRTSPLGTMVNGKTNSAQNAVTPPLLEDCVNPAINFVTTNPATAQSTGGIFGLKAVTGLLRRITTLLSRLRAGCVQYVDSLRLASIPGRTGTASSVLTIATRPTKFEDCCATTATLPLDTLGPLKQPTPLPDTSDFTTDEIVSITPSGREEVFDVEVYHTENFIANGFVSHNTRWSKLDLTGQIINHMTRTEDADEWEVVEFPAILNDKPLWPDFWPIEELLVKRASMDIRYWQAQYMQQPTSEEGALIKREWWNIWEEDLPPPCEYIIMSLDAAQEANNRADYNALTIWGVFDNEETKSKNIILLNAIKERLEYPELKALVIEQYNEWKPDSFIVEKKSNGAALYQEMRRTGIPISEFTPGKGQDKISRVNAITDLLSAGIVWAPDHRWAHEVIEECNDFPAGRNDDLVDSTTLALLRFRQGGFIRLPSDEPEPVQWFKSNRNRGYY